MPEPRQSVLEEVGAARRRHPRIDWTLTEDVGEAKVRGWAGGLRLMLDNLLENAAIHGRSPGTGLGLAIAAQQAALHGGTLELGPSDLGGLGAEVALRR